MLRMVPLHPPLRLVLLFLAIAGLSAGCQSESHTPLDTPRAFTPPGDTLAAPSEAERDSALALLRRMRRTAFDSAYVRMRNYTFTRHQRTAHLTPGGAIAALHTRTLRYAPSEAQPTVVQSDSVGAFPQPTLSAFGPSTALDSAPENVATAVVPTDAAYQSPRTQEAFQYGLRADTLDGVPVHALTVRPTTDAAGAEQAIRYARLLVAHDSDELLAASLLRRSQVLLFYEETRLNVQLRRAPDGVWIPHLAHVHTVVDLPFRAPRFVRTTSAYSNYQL